MCKSTKPISIKYVYPSVFCLQLNTVVSEFAKFYPAELIPKNYRQLIFLNAKSFRGGAEFHWDFNISCTLIMKRSKFLFIMFFKPCEFHNF